MGGRGRPGGGRGGGSDGRRAVADLRVEFVRPAGRRLLQHAVLDDGLLVGVDGGVGLIGVVPGLVAARLIGRLRGQRLFALKAQQLAGETTSKHAEGGDRCLLIRTRQRSR